MARAAIFFVLALVFQDISCNKCVKLEIPQGVLAGDERTTHPNNVRYYSFKGIPYAQAPIKELRFKAPQPPVPWKGVRDATKHGPVCPQVNILSQEYIPGSEDCLFLNVYSPNITAEVPLPVIFSIPGGAYKFGSGNDDIYGPDFLVDKGVVLVTINHRVDALGFLSLNNCEVPGNAGLKDQVAALRWVQENIKYFGGNPNQVTVIGESSAAASTGFLMVSPMAKGLFHRAIMMSGSPAADWNTSFEPRRRAFLLGATLGFETEDEAELLAFLQSVPQRQLVNTTVEVMASETVTDVIFKMMPYQPVVEPQCEKDTYLPEDPMVLLRAGKVNVEDVMFSYNSQEGLFALNLYEKGLFKRYQRFPETFVPSSILLNTTAKRSLELSAKIIKHYFGDKRVNITNFPEFINYVNSASFVYYTQKFMRSWPKYGNTFCFKFSSISNRNYYGNKGAEKYGIHGASHYDDIFYIYLANSMNMVLKKDTIEYKMVTQLTTAITNFAKYSNPNHENSLGVQWPVFDTTKLPCMEFTDKMTLEHALDENDYQFWESIYEEVGMSI